MSDLLPRIARSKLVPLALAAALSAAGCNSASVEPLPRGGVRSSAGAGPNGARAVRRADPTAAASQRGGRDERGPAAARTGATSPLPKLDGGERGRLEALSQRARPIGADDGDVRASLRKSRDGARAEVERAGLEYAWGLEPAEGRHLQWITIQEGDLRLRPFEGSWITPGEGDMRFERTSVRGGRLELETSGDLELELTPEGTALRIDIAGAPTPKLQLNLGGVLAAGSGVEDLRILQVPFFDVGSVAVLRLSDGGVRYLAAWTDPALTHAAPPTVLAPGGSGRGDQVTYAQKLVYERSTAGEVRPVRERVWVAYSDRLLDVLPSLAGDAAPRRAEASDYFFLDLHQTPFAAADLALAQLHAYGLERVYVLLRKWQRDGYDTGYPSQVMPPRAEWGGLEGLLAVSERAQAYGWRFGLHHNWVFNSERREDYSELDPGSRPRATEVDALYLKPRIAAELVEEVEGEFHEALATSGTFSDSITSTVPPLDMDAREPTWGLFGAQWLQRAEVLAALREIHDGPITGEGSFGFGTLLWTGVIDVVNGYLGMTTTAPPKETLGSMVPAIPHYKLEVVAPKLLHMGLGQPPRYLFPAARRITLAYEEEQRDHLLSASLLYATAPFHWWFNLSRPAEVARDYWSTAAPSRLLAAAERRTGEVRYLDSKGRPWSLEQMLERGESLLPGEVALRVEHVLADGSAATYWANLRPTTLELELDGKPLELAPFGRLFVGGGVRAGVVREDSGTVEFCETDDWLFLDGRGQHVERDGLATDGAVVRERLDDGALRVRCLGEFATARQARRGETLVRTGFVELGPESLEAFGGRAEVEFLGFPERTATALPEGGRTTLEWEPGEPLRVEAEQWLARDSCGFVLRPAGE